MLKKVLAGIVDWVKAETKELEKTPPYPFLFWSELPQEEWPEGYNPLEDKAFTSIDSEGKLR